MELGFSEEDSGDMGVGGKGGGGAKNLDLFTGVPCVKPPSAVASRDAARTAVNGDWPGRFSVAKRGRRGGGISGGGGG